MIEPTLFDLIQPGPVRRDRGIARVTDNEGAEGLALIDAAIERWAASGLSFTADDVRADLAGYEPHHPNAFGGRFRMAARRGLIVTVGFEQAVRPSRHAGIQRVWQGTPNESRAPGKKRGPQALVGALHEPW